METEFIYIACYVQEEPIGTYDDKIVLLAEAWRKDDIDDVIDIRISLEMDRYLDIINDCKGRENVNLTLCVDDSWEMMNEVFEDEDICISVYERFVLMEETEDTLEIFKRY